VFQVNPESDIVRVRGKLGLSQSKFAGILGFSTDTLQNSERGRRTQTGLAKALLRIAAKHPEVLWEVGWLNGEVSEVEALSRRRSGVLPEQPAVTCRGCEKIGDKVFHEPPATAEYATCVWFYRWERTGAPLAAEPIILSAR
jgi:transcriptional regulator with XRE-family HTH domain